jgi:chorismate mutase/prephenate dehydratase
MTELEYLRHLINEIDTQIIGLYEERMRTSRTIARYKRDAGMEIFDPEREQAQLSQIGDPGAQRLMRLLMDLSKEEQRRVMDVQEQMGLRGFKVAFQGIKGCYSEEAAVDFFRNNLEPVCLENFEEVFKALEQGRAERGVLPVENTSTGSINPIYDLLAAYQCHIVGEYVLPVRHCLLGAGNARLEDIREVYSHAQGFLQCETWLSSAERKHWRLTPHYDTATSAALVAQLEDPSKGAIAGRQAARTYGLHILAEDIHTYSNNYTRFIVIANHLELTPECDKISVMFSLRHESGSLYQVLAQFAVAGINLVKIESRPIPEKKWQYRFYLDLDGNLNEPRIQDALKAAETQCLEYRLLGNYVKG